MQEIEASADAIVSGLLARRAADGICILDSCGDRHPGSRFLIAGMNPRKVVEFSHDDPTTVLRTLTEHLSGETAAIFTLSYDLGDKLQGIRTVPHNADREPDVFVALYDSLLIHDYSNQRSFVVGSALDAAIVNAPLAFSKEKNSMERASTITSNFSRSAYLGAIESAKEYIRSGDNYQTNLTQQFSAKMGPGQTAQEIFWHLRTNHPTPFAAFLTRKNSSVVSASPERFLKVFSDNGYKGPANLGGMRILASPIKGTRPRGNTVEADAALRDELAASEKDLAENTMIVDLMRNDLGRISKYGSIQVDKICQIEEYPTLFHLASSVSGELRDGVSLADVLRATFPCGSITGAPKIRTMQIIDSLEPNKRGLSMGAIGCYIPPAFGFTNTLFDMSVAIRTMVVRNGIATFNVGGGIVADSDPENEYEETLVKARCLFDALGARG